LARVYDQSHPRARRDRYHGKTSDESS
jgi:integrase/recombinase XerC